MMISTCLLSSNRLSRITCKLDERSIEGEEQPCLFLAACATTKRVVSRM